MLTRNILNISVKDDKIRIEFKNIMQQELDDILNYLSDKDGFTITKNDTSIIYQSKWLELSVEKDSLNVSNCKENMSFYEICKSRDFETTKFLLRNIRKNFNHVNLSLDYDIKKFINSKYVGMFIVGKTGCGKSESINYFISSEQTNTNIFIITIKAKDIDSSYMGLSLFLNLDINYNDSDNIIMNINEVLKIKNKRLILILDGLNEINSSIKTQRKHYELLLDLVNKIFTYKCERIKLIITCREKAYKRYSESSEYFVNPICFFNNNNNINIKNKLDGCYYVKNLTYEEKKEILHNNIEISQEISILLKECDTPFFVNILSEFYLKNRDMNKLSVYDYYTTTLLNRIPNKDMYIIKKIIFTYFDLIVENREVNYIVTKYMLLDTLQIENLDIIESALNTLYDTDILVENYNNTNFIKFYHDEIEEFFFKEYLKENYYKGIDFLDNVLYLFDRNVVFQSGIIEYLKDFLINDINYFKNIVIKLFSLNQKNISNIFLELLLDENIIHNCLSPLLNENTLINIIIFGLDEKLQDYSFKDYKYFELITKIINSFFHVLNSEKKAYLYYFKSKLYYFNNNYEDSIDEANKGLAILNDSYQNLKSKINIHIAVILMEMGKSRECINILEKEFNPYKESKIYKKEGVEIAIELGRALNHSGHIESTLKVYDYVYQFENEIKSEYILSRLYEQKANVLNKKMYRILNYGLKKEKDLSEKEKDEVQNLFSEALDLYEKSISLLLKINAVWSYTGVAPEKINTYLSYSSSFKEIGIQECYTLINEIEPIFANFTTPFKTDFYLCKARYYEYLNQDTEVINSINIAIKNSNSLKNYNKLAVCYNYFAQYIYKSVILKKIANYQEVIIDALEKIESSIDYYYKNTLIKDNIILDDSIILRNNLRSLLDKN